MYKISASSLEIAAVYVHLKALSPFSQDDDQLHGQQKHFHVGGLPVRRAAVCGGSPAVHLPAAVLPALLCVGHESSHCNHGCCVQKGKSRQTRDTMSSFAFLNATTNKLLHGKKMNVFFLLFDFFHCVLTATNLLLQGIGGLQRHPQRVDRWGNRELDVCRRPALQRRDQLHPPAVVLPPADHLVHRFLVAGAGPIGLSGPGCHGAHGAHQWSARQQGQKIPGQQKCTSSGLLIVVSSTVS